MGYQLLHIEKAKCCRPWHHPDSYGHCYDEDVSTSFDSKGWSKCQRAGYFMTGFYKSTCEALHCIEKFKCCSMKEGTGNSILWDFQLNKKSMDQYESYFSY